MLGKDRGPDVDEVLHDLGVDPMELDDEGGKTVYAGWTHDTLTTHDNVKYEVRTVRPEAPWHRH